jgi:VWFA-related protein
MRRLLSAAVLAALASTVLLAQQPPSPGQPSPAGQRTVPTFRANVEAVLVDFTVVDGSGRFVRDLTADDVRVLEDGRPQTVSTFSLVDIPIEPDSTPRFAGTIVDRDSVSNVGAEGRLFLIALDDVHVHPLRNAVTQQVARQFIEKNLGPNDRAALVAMSGRYALAHEFTGNRQRLLAAIDKLQAGFGPFDQSNDVSARGGARATFHYLESLARWMSGLEGRRKAIVFISEGFSADIPTDGSQPDDLPPAGPTFSDLLDPGDTASVFDGLSALSEDTTSLREVIDAAARANVSIFTIDPRGMPGQPWTTIKPVTNLAGDDVFSPHRRAARRTMLVLAEETGGFAFERSNDFSGAFERIVRDTSSYYVLGYVSDNPARDGKFRRVRVQATRPGLRIRARTGYLPRTDKAKDKEKIPNGWTADHVALVDAPLQTGGLGLRMAAAPFRTKSALGSVAVIVEAGGPDLAMKGQQSPSLEPFTVTLLAADQDGTMKAQGRGRFELDAKTPASARQDGIRFVSRLELKPGRYNLRVAGADGSGSPAGRGSVFYDLDVPDFSKGPLAMSGLLVSSRTSERRFTIGHDAAAGDVLEHTATAARVFQRDDELVTMVDVYRNAKRPVDLRVVTSVQTPDGRAVFEDRQSFEAARTSPFPGLVHSTHVPLRDLAPGDYLLRIDASNVGRENEKVSRQVVFSVR